MFFYCLQNQPLLNIISTFKTYYMDYSDNMKAALMLFKIRENVLCHVQQLSRLIQHYNRCCEGDYEILTYLNAVFSLNAPLSYTGTLNTGKSWHKVKVQQTENRCRFKAKWNWTRWFTWLGWYTCMWSNIWSEKELYPFVATCISKSSSSNDK